MPSSTDKMHDTNFVDSSSAGSGASSDSENETFDNNSPAPQFRNGTNPPPNVTNRRTGFIPNVANGYQGLSSFTINATSVRNSHRRHSVHNFCQRMAKPQIDPYFEPKILRKNNSIPKSESQGSLVKESKVLVIYTGGTIGMVKSEGGVYAPCPGALGKALRKYPQLHDQEYFDKYFSRESNELLVLPETGEKNRVVYTIYEYDPLLDSSNMTIDDWVLIAQNIKREYHRFTGFVILHGTDTMAYTASALSMMLENLGKTVVITGSQIPLFEARSDGKENMLNSLIIAGNYCIPEVTILFNNKLFRGNRTSKISASNLDAFDSPNMSPLVNIGININVDWNNVYRPSTIAKFNVHSTLNRNVTLLRIFPSITAETIQAFLRSPIKGVVLQTYGAGNAPSNRKDILNEFRKATDRGVIIVNITQCPNGKVDPSYETGNALLKAGVIPGSDMTPEACLAKLSYILSKDDWSLEKKREMVKTNLRGELTVIRQQKVEDISLIQAIAHTLKVSTSDEMEKLRTALYPAIVCAISSRGDLESLRQLKKSGVDLSACDYDQRTPLHIAVNHGHVDVVKYLLAEGASVHAKDKNGDTPLGLAIKNEDEPSNQEIVTVLRKAGAFLDRRIGDRTTIAASTGRMKKLQTLKLAGASLDERDTFSRTPLHVAVERNQIEIVQYLVNEVKVSLSKTDINNRTAKDIAIAFKHNTIIAILDSADKEHSLTENSNESD